MHAPDQEDTALVIENESFLHKDTGDAKTMIRFLTPVLWHLIVLGRTDQQNPMTKEPDGRREEKREGGKEHVEGVE